MRNRPSTPAQQRPAPLALRCLPALAGLALVLLANDVKAANSYFDVNGTSAGYGVAGGGSYSWDDPNWAAAAGGTSATTTWTSGDFPRFPGAVNFTVTVNNSESLAGLLLNNDATGANTVTINAAGAGNLNLLPNASLTAGLPAQGFFGQGSTVTINAPIIGTGAVQIPTGGGSIQLYGNNSFSGGVSFSSSATLTYFNNNNSFGTGPLCLNSSAGSFANLLNTGGSSGSPLTITLANNFTNILGGFVNFGSSAYTPVVCTGPWALKTFNMNIRNNGDTTAPLTLNGIISGSGTLTFSANNGGKITLGGANTYTGKTSIAGGSNIPGVGMPVSVGGTPGILAFNKVSGGSAASNLGAPTTAAAGTIGIGLSSFTSTLIYTGSGETTDRIIDLAGTTGGATLEADGTGALVLTANNTASGVGSKALTLQGSSTAANSIGKIVDSSSGATAVVKGQAGKWVLTAANTYTGGTTVNQGTLEISGSVAGSVTNMGGVLTLDNASTMAATATLAIFSGSTVNLNFPGTNAVNSLVIDGGAASSGVWGPVGSTAPNQSPIFAGAGFINVLGKPVILLQPVSTSVFPDATATFNIAVAGDLSTATYQWKRNGVNLSDSGSVFGSASPNLTISPAEAPNAGTYSCAVTNAFGFAVSSNATLIVMGTNAYTQTIRGDGPIAYWRLDETSGNVAYDGVGGHNGGYINALLNQPGFSVVPGSDPSMGVPANVAQHGYMIVSNAAPAFSFVAAPFTLEAWGYSTNFALGVKQRLISTLNNGGLGSGFGFGMPDANTVQFTAGGVVDFNSPTLATPLASGVWYHFVVTCDGNSYTLYLNGAPLTNAPFSSLPNGGATRATVDALTLGNNPPSYPASEQLYGRVDEVAVYSYALSQSTVTNHYLARYIDAPLSVSAPVALPPTNYVSLSSSLQAVAAGAGLNYQWYKGAGTGSPVGGNSDTLTLAPLTLGNAASYHVVVTDAGNHTQDSPLTYLAVLPIPTSADQLDLTNGLVLHLPLDGDYGDISGRGNNGTAVGSPTFVTPSAIGGKALRYSTGTTAGSTNYVTLGVRPDLQFSSNIDFTVSYWTRGNGSANTNLPFFTDAIGGVPGILNLSGGFCFEPGLAADGGWSLGLGSATHEMSSEGSAGVLNDGNWHHVVHVAKRIGNMTTYVDGAQVDSQAISYIDNINTANPANIGQDATGAQAVGPLPQVGDLDDLAVWTRTLTPLEVSGIYLAGATNHVSFAPVVVSAPPLTSTTISNIIGSTLTYGGGSGTHFVLLGTNNLSAPVSTWPRLLTNNATPGSFNLPASPNASMFYRISSEN